MEQKKRQKPGPKPDPNKIRATMVPVYLSDRRKQALRELSVKVDDGVIAQVVTRAIEEVYGKQLDNIETSL